MGQDFLDLQKKAQQGDLNAHLALGCKAGLYTKEDLEWFVRMENEEKEE